MIGVTLFLFFFNGFYAVKCQNQLVRIIQLRVVVEPLKTELVMTLERNGIHVCKKGEDCV